MFGSRDPLALCKILALLAKQVWRLVQFPNTLAAKVLKCCYFPDSSILQASEVSSSSYLWKSFLWGKILLDVGSRWRIGNGRSVLIYHQRWLPRPISFMIQSPQILDNLAMVESIKFPSGLWNAPLIRSSFWPEEAEVILNLPCSNPSVLDFFLWHYKKLGSYSVRSGYHIGYELEANSGSSGLKLDVSWWKFLWRLKIPSKVKVLIWRACLNWVPFNGNLGNRGIKVDPCYPVCHSSPESSFHALWGCRLLKKIRSLCGFMAGIHVPSHSQFIDFMSCCKN
ncbi:hypothetical protein LWI28_019065 [Acer negundo]|uniref:Reverse transcriptase zinc-binding domain-containing protein n=1 Tax=Acer negundo TaxID=4023 RepID=A0AAD5IG52_ACENE|nr:hypothetical protein LWI28_019065 [Acer negundo]